MPQQKQGKTAVPRSEIFSLLMSEMSTSVVITVYKATIIANNDNLLWSLNVFMPTLAESTIS
jgi:hypothetical protein